MAMFLRFAFALLLAGSAASVAAQPRTAYDFAFTGINGSALPLANYRGKAILIVNTASRCGFTHQLADMQELWQRYRDRGLVVIGAPSNDFGGQEPGSEETIARFCESRFGIDFPMTAKLHVRGKRIDPFYAWAAEELGPAARPLWNFHKYLIGPDGRLVAWFSTPTAPLSDKIVRAVEAQLARIGRTGS
jgi:glutathione peroxidase